MKILLDESAPQKNAAADRWPPYCHYNVVPRLVRAEKGALLRAAEVEGFDLLITADQDLSYQQNLAGRSMALLVLSTNNWRLVKAQMAEISAAIDDATPGSFVFVDIGHARGECFCRL